MAVPTIGNGLYWPVRAMIWPLATEVTSRPSTIGSRYTPDMVAETPRTTCRNSGRKDSAPNIAKPAANPMPEPTVNTLFRNRFNGKTGSAACRADNHQPASSTAEPQNRPMITGELHG
jgi:hypothetical protein